jgi:hypothetical protein
MPQRSHQVHLSPDELRAAVESGKHKRDYFRAAFDFSVVGYLCQLPCGWVWHCTEFHINVTNSGANQPEESVPVDVFQVA